MAKRYKRQGPRARTWTPEANARREKAIGRNPWGGYNHNNIGCEFARVGYWAAAVSEFERAVEINPWQASFKANLARAYLGAGELNKAQAAVDAALREEPEMFAAMITAAMIQEKLNHIDAALRWYRRCLSAKTSWSQSRQVVESIAWLIEKRERSQKP
ncbi:MAG: tetratricopeptide repeat protein [Elusimicrobia bacterium]|nr:tetratricopeptide repeat protein [Elusimicrobiota bacterium]